MIEAVDGDAVPVDALDNDEDILVRFSVNTISAELSPAIPVVVVTIVPIGVV